MKQQRHTTIGLLVLFLLSACALEPRTLDTTPVNLLEEESREPRDERPAISLVVYKHSPMTYAMGFEGSDLGRVTFSYDGVFEAALERYLSDRFVLSDPSPDIPHVTVTFRRQYWSQGYCKYHGLLSDCYQRLNFFSDFWVTLGSKTSETSEVKGSGSASQDNVFSRIVTLEPLHRLAVKRAFLEYSQRLANKIDAELVSLN